MILLVLCGVIGLVVVLLVLMPFFVGPGGQLEEASPEDSLELLQKKREVLLERWIQDEKDAATGALTAREWALRQVHLTNRYVDATRRIDALQLGSVKK